MYKCVFPDFALISINNENRHGYSIKKEYLIEEPSRKEEIVQIAQSTVVAIINTFAPVKIPWNNMLHKKWA